MIPDLIKAHQVLAHHLEPNHELIQQLSVLAEEWATFPPNQEKNPSTNQLLKKSNPIHKKI